MRAITLSFSLSVVFLSYSVVFLYGGYLSANRQLLSGHFFIIIETLIYGSMTIGQSSVFTSDYRKAKISAANIFRLVDSRRKTSKETLIKSGNIEEMRAKGEIRFSDVRFAYPERRESPILRGLSFECKSGQKVALVGQSGCGKSTTIQLLQHFYDVTKGSIVILID